MFGDDDHTATVDAARAHALHHADLGLGVDAAAHQGDEVLWCVARQGRAAELRVLAHEVPLRGAHVQLAVGEIAAPAARDTDLLGHLLGMVDE